MIRRFLRFSVFATCFTGTVALADTTSQAAIASFNAICFTKGLSAGIARTRMEARDGAPLPYTLTFWDRTLGPAPKKAPPLIERRCEVRFGGAHTDAAISALRKKMSTAPVFGVSTALPGTHVSEPGTALIEGRELLRGRIAVVHVGTENSETFIAVDRLPADWEARL